MLKINDIIIDQNHFPDNSLLVKFDPYEPDFEWADGITIEWHYENDAELFTLICLKRHLDHFFDCNTCINLYLPYVPHARMDRVKDSSDVFTLKYFCEVINSLKFNIVFVEDVHSNVALALLEKVVELPIRQTIERVLDWCTAPGEDKPLVFYPDEGAMKRYSSMIKTPYTFGVKKRDWQTGKINSLEVINPEMVAGQNILIVDDICSYGGTFLHSARALKEAGANHIFLYITHCETSVLEGEMIKSGLIDKIFTTRSIYPLEKQNEIIKVMK